MQALPRSVRHRSQQIDMLNLCEVAESTCGRQRVKYSHPGWQWIRSRAFDLSNDVEFVTIGLLNHYRHSWVADVIFQFLGQVSLKQSRGKAAYIEFTNKR